jgi:hypothetical protein
MGIEALHVLRSIKEKETTNAELKPVGVYYLRLVGRE